MSNTCCGNCGCDPCLCENPYQPDVDNLKEGTPVIQITGEPESSCLDPDAVCPVGPQCEAFTIPASIELAEGPGMEDDTIGIEVCDPGIYTPGMCVTIYGSVTNSASNQAVLRVEAVGTLADRIVTLRQYRNESDNEGAILSGNLYICPMSHCLEVTVPPVPVCYQLKILTTEQFTVPDIEGGPTAELTLAECTDFEVGDRIHIRDDLPAGSIGCYDIHSINPEGDVLFVTNPGLTGNAAETTTLAAGARVTLVSRCIDEPEEEAELWECLKELCDAEEKCPRVWHKSFTPSAYTDGSNGAYIQHGSSLSIMDTETGLLPFYVDVPVESGDILLCQGHVTIGSPKCSVIIKADNRPHPYSTGVSATTPANPTALRTNCLDGVEWIAPTGTDGNHGQHHIPFHTCYVTEILVASQTGTMRVTFHYGNPYYLNNDLSDSSVNGVIYPLWNRNLTITKIDEYV